MIKRKILTAPLVLLCFLHLLYNKSDILWYLDSTYWGYRTASRDLQKNSAKLIINTVKNEEMTSEIIGDVSLYIYMSVGERASDEKIGEVYFVPQ